MLRRGPFNATRRQRRAAVAAIPQLALEVAIPQASLRGGRKQVLVVLFVPSVGRDGRTRIAQEGWVDAALEMSSRTFA